MATSVQERSVTEIRHDVERQRAHVDATIDRLRERLTPGQLVDEVLARTKDGGGEFLASFGRSATANPVPVALLGVSLAWLMAAPNRSASQRDDESDRVRDWPGEDMALPVYPIEGDSIRRVRHSQDDQSEHWAEFADNAGRSFKAKTDEFGRRAGHFIDSTGKTYRGFANAAGEQIDQFRDEAGNMLDSASDWASHTWRRAGESLTDVGESVRSGADSISRHAVNAGTAVGVEARKVGDTIASVFERQPLVGGALAFAAGAALAAAFPRTEREDKLVGEYSDRVKAMAGEEAGKAYESAKSKVADVYDKTAEHAGQVYDQAVGAKSDATPAGSKPGARPQRGAASPS